MAPDMAKATAAHEDMGRQYPPPKRLMSTAMDTSFV